MPTEPTEKQKLSIEVKEKIIGYILAAFGLVAGLAWNDAIKSLIEKIFPATGSGLIAKFAYAVLITLIIIIISFNLTKLIKKQK
ncbi:MAG: DUF5654 family protein [Candidatus Komeilibacteria bacterium]|nr:DUF5654 family protein [Candidatus Komeilibacteria bacterium]